MELLDVGTHALRSPESVDLDDVDVVPSSLVHGGHLVVHLIYGTSTSGVPVLLVKVVDASSRSVAEIDAEVLDSGGLPLFNLVDGEELTLGLLDLLQLAHEIPEARLGNDVILSKNAHTVHLGVGVRIGRDTTTDDLVLVVGLERMNNIRTQCK